jgi:hypothetical protein
VSPGFSPTDAVILAIVLEPPHIVLCALSSSIALIVRASAACIEPAKIAALPRNVASRETIELISILQSILVFGV